MLKNVQMAGNFKVLSKWTGLGGYGNTGYGVSSPRIQNKKGFCLEINCSQMKLLNFENWCNGEVSKSA